MSRYQTTRIVTAGLSTAAAFGIVAALAADDAESVLPDDSAPAETAVVEIRIDPDVDEAAAAAAVRAWLDGSHQPGQPAVALVEREGPPDTVTEAS
jgi:hypothetical protein